MKKRNINPIEVTKALDLYKSGERDKAFITLFPILIKAVEYAMGNKIKLRTCEMEDIVQRSAICMLRSLDTYDETKSNFFTYLQMIIKSVLINNYNHEQTKREVIFNSTSLDRERDCSYHNGKQSILDCLAVNPPEEKEPNKYQRQYLRNVIKTLTPLERTVLYYLNEGLLSYDEIAAKMNTTKKTIDNAKSRIARKAKNDILYSSIKNIIKEKHA